MRAIQQTISTQAASGNGSEILKFLLIQKPKFKVDLRLEGVPEDLILKDVEMSML